MRGRGALLPWLLLGLLLGLLPAGRLCAEPALTQPLWVRDQAPLAQLFGLPRMLGGQLASGSYELSLGADAANNFMAKANPEGYLYLDGESLLWSLSLRGQWRPGTEVWLVVPYLRQGGGRLDRLVDGYHDLFGFSPQGRDEVPRNQILYFFAADGEIWISQTQPSRGLGDVRLGLGQALSAGADWALTGRAQLKLPTGDSAHLIGSGASDLAFWLEYQHQGLGHPRLALNLGAGMTLLGEGDLLPARQLRTLWLAHGQLGLGLGRRWSGHIQLDAHQRLYATSLRQAGYHALLLSLGLRYRQQAWYADWVLTEDLRPDSSADLALQWRLARRF